MSKNKSSITFYGGAGSVTGANFLFECRGKKILVDCGLMQGAFGADNANAMPFMYDPSIIDYLFVTHAHLDHVGRIPKLVKDGFNGKIISTSITKEVAVLMLEDELSVLQSESNRKGEPFFDRNDIANAMRLWEGVEYHNPIDIGGIKVEFKDSGHIIGSAIIEFSADNKKIVFTGDLGNSPSLLLKDTEKIVDANFMVMESVYGDRNHQSRKSREEKLKKVIKDNYSRGGTLVIPSFSLERTQVLLYELNHLVERGEIPSMPVFLDSPLGIKITEIYRRLAPELNRNVTDALASGDDIFSFPRLEFISDKKDSNKLADIKGAKIIIAGSGMSVGGRVISHEKEYLPGAKNTILMVGYQEVGTLGRKLLEGAKRVKIHGVEVKVRAKIESIEGYSSHKDSDHLIEFVQDSANSLEKVFVVMGEPKSSLFLVQRLRDWLGVNASSPMAGDKEEIDF